MSPRVLTRKEQKSFMVRAKVLFIKLPKLQCSIKKMTKRIYARSLGAAISTED
jgi:hypothetical protein